MGKITVISIVYDLSIHFTFTPYLTVALGSFAQPGCM